MSVVPRQDWLHPTLRGYFANGAVAFYTFREQVRQTVASWDRPHQTPPRPTPAPIEIVTLPAASQPTSQPATAPAIRYRECPSGLSLSGVIHTPDGAFASINGKMVKVGGVANGATLTAIRDFSVEMEIAGERFILGIGESSPAAGPSDEGPSDEPATKPAKKIKSKAKVKAKRPHTQPAEEEDEPAPEE